METFTNLVTVINGWVWGPLMLALIGLTGLFLMVGLAFYPLRKIVYALRLLGAGDSRGEGDIPPFKALMTALAATVGTGNIAGVATAIFLGGPGALFYMWLIALVGMATKYAEAVCALTFREVDENGRHVGGPMYYLRNGVGKRFPALGGALALLFAIFAAIAGFGIGNTIQSNSVAHALEASFGIDLTTTGIVMAAVVALVIFGGIRRIADVAGALVPFMMIAYVLAALGVIVAHIDQIPHAFSLVFTHAFQPAAAAGGFAGATVAAAIRFGVARGVFSNEAGMGSAPIAHAAAVTDNPVRQGNIAMLGTFFDTIVICTMTGLAILVTGAWTSGENGAALTTEAFSTMPLGAEVVAVSLAIFAFSSILGWSYYCERALEFLFGVRAILPFRILWIVAVPLGSLTELNMLWLIADTLNALMAIPNLIGLIILAPMVFTATRAYWKADREEM